MKLGFGPSIEWGRRNVRLVDFGLKLGLGHGLGLVLILSPVLSLVRSGSSSSRLGTPVSLGGRSLLSR